MNGSRVLAFAIAFSLIGFEASAAIWQPAPGHAQVPLWPGKAPDSESVPGLESILTSKQLVAGKPVTWLTNVTQPTLTVYKPKVKNTGVAIVVFPGGGFEGLALDLEGTEVCDWLVSRGITCVLLKYRVPTLPFDWHTQSRPHNLETPKAALEDAQRTLVLVRFHAAEWGIDPHKIGVIGFSAGGFLAAEISTKYKQRVYAQVDAAEKESCRPDFAMAIYPGHLSVEGENYKLNSNVPVTKDTPPTFIVQAEDDSIDGVNQALTYFIALKKADVPAEMHLYAHGGHAFGLRHTTLPITDWPRLAETWLHTIGIVSRKDL